MKERLQVLPPREGSCYDEFNLCPSDALPQKLNRAEILIENWHNLMPLKEADRSVVKMGRVSDEAFTRRVLGKLAGRHLSPVMPTDFNRTETAARIEPYFNSGDAHRQELRAPKRTLTVDSKVLEKFEIGETATSDKDYKTRLKGIIEAAHIPEARRRRFISMKR